jgi:hypothetical protein
MSHHLQHSAERVDMRSGNTGLAQANASDGRAKGGHQWR